MLATEPVDHPAGGVPGRAEQVRPDAVGGVAAAGAQLGMGIGRSEELRRAELDVLPDGQSHGRAHRRLDGRPADLAIALRRVAVAGGDPTTRLEDGQEQRRAGDEMARIHVPAVDVGRDRRQWTARGGNADDAAERRPWQPDTGHELDRAPSAERRHVIGGLGELVSEQSKTRDDRGPAPIRWFERKKIDLKDVAGFGTMDSDRAANLVDAFEVELQQLRHAAPGIELAAAGVKQVELDDGA